MTAGSEIAARYIRETEQLKVAKREVACILSEMRDWQAKTLLHGALVYGWRQPDGMWRQLGDLRSADPVAVPSGSSDQEEGG